MDSTNFLLQQFRLSLGDGVKKVALFGSVVEKSISKASDIDILLFVDPMKFRSVRKQVASLNLPGTVVRVEKALCSYNKLPTTKPSDKGEKPIHVVFLPSRKKDYVRTSFWRKHNRCIRFF